MARRRGIVHKTKWFGAILIGILVVVLVLTFTSKKGIKKTNKQIVVGIAQEPDSLDPILLEMAAAREIQGLLFEDMVERDDQWVLQPRLVEEMPTLKNGLLKQLPGDKIQVTWRFKKGLKWSDGKELNAHDAIFAYHLVMDERIPVISRDAERRIEKMEAPNDHTLVVTWKEPYAYAGIGGHWVLPRHILEPVYKSDPEKYKEAPFGRAPVGNGPYQLEEWVSGSHLSFKPNPHWHGEKPKFERIIYKIIPNTNALETNLLSGTIDAISPNSISVDQGIDFENRHGTEFKVLYRPALVWEHIDCNFDNAILKDKRVRQALLYGANRQKMNEILFKNRQQVSDSWLPPLHYGFNPKIKTYPHDPEKAKGLLQEAGWIETPGGIRVNSRGQKLKLTIMTTAGNHTREQIQQILQNDWRNIGVELDINNQPAKVFFGETMRQRKFEHLALYAWVSDPISDGETLWTAKNIPSGKNNWQGQNMPGWVNEESDEILHKVPVTLDEAARKEMLQRQQRIWTEELPVLPMFFRTDVAITHPALKNWRLTGMMTPITWNAEEWSFQ